MRALRLLALALLAGGCTIAAPAPPTIVYVTVTPTPESVPSADSSPSESPTPAPSPSPTQTPTPTPGPTESPIPSPEPLPSPPRFDTILGDGFLIEFAADEWSVVEPTVSERDSGVLTWLSESGPKPAAAISFAQFLTERKLDDVLLDFWTPAVGKLFTLKVDGVAAYQFNANLGGRSGLHTLVVNRGVFYRASLVIDGNLPASAADARISQYQAIIASWRWK